MIRKYGRGKNIKSSNDKPEIKNIKRFHSIMFLFSVVLIIFCIRWQVIEADKFLFISQNRTYNSELRSQRGSIYSSDGSTLAYSEPRFDMYVWMDDLIFFEENELQTRDEFIEKVAPVINRTQEELENIIKSNYEESNIRWFQIAKSLSTEQWAELKDLKTDRYSNRPLGGFILRNVPTRVYPEGRLASHLVGLTNIDEDQITGVGGIEESYNGVLNPITGFITQETDAIGQTITNSLLPTIEPKDGSDIYTSINKRLQQVVEKMIKEGVEKYEASSGSILIMDPKTGSIMALANFPDYDPNLREETDPATYVNSAVTAPYEAGSIGKVVTSAAGIDLGLMDPDTVILENGHDGCEKIHDDLEPLCTWDKKPKGPMNLQDCLVASDNICFYHIAKKMDNSDFYKYMVDFGIGHPTGVDIINQDSYGILKRPEFWNEGDIAAFSYGHGYQVNVVQAGDYVAAIANNGVRMKPKVVDRIVTSDGVTKEYKPTVVTRVLSQRSSDKVVDMMRAGYQSSFASNEYFYNDIKNHYDLGVKSGTALIATSSGYSNDIYATFVGFDASPERTFVMVVKLERPLVPFVDRLAFYNVRPLWLDTFIAVKDIIGVPRK